MHEKEHEQVGCHNNEREREEYRTPFIWKDDSGEAKTAVGWAFVAAGCSFGRNQSPNLWDRG